MPQTANAIVRFLHMFHVLPIDAHKIPCNPMQTQATYRFGQRRCEGQESSATGWTALSRHSRTRSTPRAGSRCLPPSAPCSSATATCRAAPRAAEAASTATPRSTLRPSMQAARALRARSTGFSTACRIIRTSATSCLSRSMVTSTSSRSIRTDASCFLSRFAPMPAFRRNVTFVGLGSKFQMWEPARFEERRRLAREKVQDHRRLFGAGTRLDQGDRGGEGGARE